LAGTVSTLMLSGIENKLIVAS